jgi:hypothetical protein
MAMDRERRAVWKARIELHRRAGRITDGFAFVALAMLRRLGADGRLDPAQGTIAADAGESLSTVKRALGRLRELGLCWWVRRIAREGWRSQQTSNAYCLTLGDAVRPAPASEAQTGRGTVKEDFTLVSPEVDRPGALAALAAVRGRMEARLLMKGRGAAGQGATCRVAGALAPR